MIDFIADNVLKIIRTLFLWSIFAEMVLRLLLTMSLKEIQH